ncbi:paraquat-inducible protein A [Salinimonas sediminis]|uniref:Paraquat-inducible protein A n=1 Tax=Salinimonas sediminis TaxID=2303538 RepID=A0A346NKC1_9ALTE|nr:paraquat-inducible protein A [Salinimonas sediminis]AXR05978.1 paraquat-inducible protein A [Salinimonas sediminis]
MSATGQQTTITCDQCYTDVAIPPLSHCQEAFCPKCEHELLSFRKNGHEHSLAFAVSGLFLLLLSLPFNFLIFKSNGQQHSINITDTLNVLIEQDYLSLAVITALAILIIPFIVLLGISVLSLLCIRNQRWPGLRLAYRSVNTLSQWSMAEVFMVGTLVSLIKITSLAEVSYGISFYTFIGFAICLTLALVNYDKNRLGLWLFRNRLPKPKKLTVSGASVSVQRTWALLLVAALLYIPANVLPIMHTELFGRSEPSTIVGGAISLWQSGSYPVAIVILIASVAVPVAKIAILAWLNFTVQHRFSQRRQTRVKFYRFTEAIGRWSMIDVFVVAILVGLIQLGNTISIYPGPAALAFCAVVFVTMVAAITFDSRLIWIDRKTINE